MSKINVNESSKAKSNKSSSSSKKDAAGHDYSVALKGLSTILTKSSTTLNNINKSVDKIRESVEKLEKSALSGGGNNSNDNSAAAQNKSNREREGFGSLFRGAISSLGKTLRDTLLLNNEKDGKKSGGFLSKLLTGLGVALTAGLSMLPLLFTNTLNGLFTKLLTSLGVGKGTAGFLSEHIITPGIQGAAIGYGLTKSVGGMLAGAAIGIGWHAVNSLTTKLKQLTGVDNEDDDSFLGGAIEGLGNAAKGAIAGAVIGYKFGGIKGLVSGALIGTAAGAIYSLGSQLITNITNPKEQSTADLFGGLGKGAFTGAIAGASLGFKFGGIHGMLIGLAAGAIIGGAAGLISGLISDFRAKRAATKKGTYELKDKLGMNNKDHMFLNDDDNAKLNKELAEAEARSKDASLGKTEQDKAKQRIKEIKTLKDGNRRLAGYQKTLDMFKQWDITSDIDLEGILYDKDDDGKIRPRYKPDYERLGALYKAKHPEDTKAAKKSNSSLGKDLFENILKEHPEVKGYLDSISSAWTSGAKGKDNYGEGGSMTDDRMQESLKALNSGASQASLTTQAAIDIAPNKKSSLSKAEIEEAMDKENKQLANSSALVSGINKLVELEEAKQNPSNGSSSKTKTGGSGTAKPNQP